MRWFRKAWRAHEMGPSVACGKAGDHKDHLWIADEYDDENDGSHVWDMVYCDGLPSRDTTP